MPFSQPFEWNAETAEKLYNLPGWSGGYFSVSDEGHVMVRPNRAGPEQPVDLFAICQELQRRGLEFPVLVRFPDLLIDRINQLRLSFEKAMKSEEYSGEYKHVYPIKVNQQERVVHEVVNYQSPGVGLEAGSKPEMIAVMALAPPGCVIVCNGYKDREFIRLALLLQSMGHRTYLVIEKLSELELALEEAAKLGIEPTLGIRVRLSAIGKGKWQNSGGERSKFGLTAEQILVALTVLREHNLLHTLKLIHFHLGSQIPNINDIKIGIREAARYYVELVKFGTGIDTIDVGGGLGVDYEGSRSRNSCSMNYSMDEYATSIVHIFNEMCLENDLTPPDIITESGRAIVAHHAILISNVIDSDAREVSQEIYIPSDDEPSVLYDLKVASSSFGTGRSPVEIYHDIVHLNNELQTLFATGNISLTDRAQGEKIFLQTCHQLRQHLYPTVRSHLDIIDEINDRLASKYFVNLSIFQSMPDIWAIDQLFPIMPLHRLNERPTEHVVLYDLTCDSDGHIEDYVCSGITTKSLPLHPYDGKDLYLLGFFLVGAYQETLGDIHNLFGDTHSVNVKINNDGTFTLDEPIAGDTIRKMLGYVQYDCDDLLILFRDKLRTSKLTPHERQAALNTFCTGLDSYTYLVR